MKECAFCSMDASFSDEQGLVEYDGYIFGAVIYKQCVGVKQSNKCGYISLRICLNDGSLWWFDDTPKKSRLSFQRVYEFKLQRKIVYCPMCGKKLQLKGW